MKTVETRHYKVKRPGRYLHVFAYTACNYKNNNMLHTYHNSKRVWSACAEKAVVCAKRTKQVEKFCRLTGARPEKHKEVLP